MCFARMAKMVTRIKRTKSYFRALAAAFLQKSPGTRCCTSKSGALGWPIMTPILFDPFSAL